MQVLQNLNIFVFFNQLDRDRKTSGHEVTSSRTTENYKKSTTYWMVVFFFHSLYRRKFCLYWRYFVTLDNFFVPKNVTRTFNNKTLDSTYRKKSHL